MKNEIKRKIHAHLGPMVVPNSESVVVSPKEQSASMMHDMEIIFPSLSAQCEENQQTHIDALVEVQAERLSAYLQGLEDTKPALYETLSNLIRI